MTWSDLQKSVPRVQNVGIISVFFSPPIHSHPSLPFFQECLSWPHLRLLGAFTLSGDLFCVAPAGPQPFAPSSWCGDAGRLPVAFGSPRKPGQAHDSAQSHSGGKTKMTSHKGFPPFMSSSASGSLLGGHSAYLYPNLSLWFSLTRPWVSPMRWPTSASSSSFHAIKRSSRLLEGGQGHGVKVRILRCREFGSRNHSVQITLG